MRNNYGPLRAFFKNGIGIFLLLTLLALATCVSRQKYEEVEKERDTEREAAAQLKEQLKEKDGQRDQLQTELDAKNNKLTARDAELNAEKARTKSLENQLKNLQSTNKSLLDRLSDLSVISKAGADSIKKSIDAINSQNMYIKDLNGMIQQKDQLNLALVTSLKRSLADQNDEDVTVDVKKGVVFISLSDKMLFRSGSAEILPTADVVLGKIATVINDHKDLDVLVEGHTDSDPISNACMIDNWDLSTKRSTSIVRVLQGRYNVRPERLTAAGRSEYVPKASNESPSGKSANRRTEILILPKLDQFFKLIEPAQKPAEKPAAKPGDKPAEKVERAVKTEKKEERDARPGPASQMR